MFGNHVTKHLSAHYHGELPAAETARVEKHLKDCARCRAAYEEIRFGAQLASRLRVTEAPLDVLQASPSRSQSAWIPLAAAAALAVTLLSWMIVRTPLDQPSQVAWAVESVRGTTRIGKTAIGKMGILRVGETLQTESASEASVQIANIGRMTVDPNTKLRLQTTESNEHRIFLERGKLEALTWAPPRLFIVDTPSARAVDLGCKYSLEVQKDGSSLLHVTLGMVSLASHGRESFVPAYNLARSRSGFGPGTPYAEEASERYKAALEAIDFGKPKVDWTSEVEIILSEAKDRDATTLWHLLARVDFLSRTKVYDRLAEFIPPPEGTTREGVLSLNATMLRNWAESIPELWWMKKSTP